MLSLVVKFFGNLHVFLSVKASFVVDQVSSEGPLQSMFLTRPVCPGHFRVVGLRGVFWERKGGFRFKNGEHPERWAVTKNGEHPEGWAVTQNGEHPERWAVTPNGEHPVRWAVATNGEHP